MKKNMQKISLTDKQKRELMWFANQGIDLPQNYAGRKNDQQKALAAKGLIRLSEDGDDGYLTEDGLAYLEADPVASRLIVEYRRVVEKRDEMARAMVVEIENALHSDPAFASLFSAQGYLAAQYLFKPGSEGYTEHQMSGALHAFCRYLEQTKHRMDHLKTQLAIQAEYDKRNEYIKSQGWVNYSDAADLLGISESEFRFAFEKGMIAAVRTPWEGSTAYYGNNYYDRAKLSLTDEQRREIRQSTLLTKWQAAERLGIDAKVFDKIKKKAHLQHAAVYPTNSGWPGYLYRQEDVDGLKDYL